MKVFHLTLISFASQAISSRVCYTGTLKIGHYILTEDDIITALLNQVNSSILAVANHDAKLMSFLKRSGDCQAHCLGIVMKPALSTLYGELGEEFVSSKKHVHETFVEAVAGAFRACYPFPPRQQVKKVAQAIVRKVGKVADAIVAGVGSASSFPKGVDCMNQGHEDDFPVSGFMNSFKSRFMKVPVLQKVFDTDAKDCQKSCLETSVSTSALTLFQTNNSNDEAGIDALTGAMHACFPGVPDINVLVNDEKDMVERTEIAAERQACFTGNIKIGKRTLTEDHIIAALENKVNASVLSIAQKDSKVANFFKTHGNCQADCLRVLLKPTFSTLYGDFGYRFVSNEKQVHDTFVEAVSGAFRACYPAPPREQMKQVAEAIVLEVRTLARAIVTGISLEQPSSVLFPPGVDCANEGHQKEFPLNNFLKSFKDRLKMEPQLKRFFGTDAKDCQKTCLDRAVATSATTLFLTNNNEDDVGIDALTGAIHACFPGTPDISRFANDEKSVVEGAEREAYEQEARSSLGSGWWSFFSMWGFFSCLCLFIFYSGMALGRRWKRHPVRQVENEQLLSTYRPPAMGGTGHQQCD